MFLACPTEACFAKPIDSALLPRKRAKCKGFYGLARNPLKLAEIAKLLKTRD
jgi:hypothetical protein